jgi:hypothetical protein
MKKLFSASGFTPSVFKGIYIVFLLILSTSSSFAQVAKKDTTSFNKWEVSVDLKPLFRKDEPYNLFVKRYLTERKVVRLGLGVYENNKNILVSNSIGEINAIQEFLSDTFNYKYQYIQIRPDSNYEKSNSFVLSLGFQYILTKNKVSVYIATDVVYSYVSHNYDFSTGDAGTYDSNNNPVYAGTKTFVGYDSRYQLDEYLKTYSIKQQIGFSYSVNKSLSLSFEMGATFQFSHYSKQQFDKPYPDQRYNKAIWASYNFYNWKFNPMAGLFLNYLF